MLYESILWFISPPPVKPGGTIGLHSVSLSVRLSVCPSVCPSHSFPNFSPTCIDILSWNFAYDFVLLYYRSSSSVINLRPFCVGVMPLLELKILEIHSFTHFSLTCFDILSWNFTYDFVLLYYRSSTDQVRVSSICVHFCGSYAPFET